MCFRPPSILDVLGSRLIPKKHNVLFTLCMYSLNKKVRHFERNLTIGIKQRDSTSQNFPRQPRPGNRSHPAAHTFPHGFLHNCGVLGVDVHNHARGVFVGFKPFHYTLKSAFEKKIATNKTLIFYDPLTNNNKQKIGTAQNAAVDNAPAAPAASRRGTRQVMEPNSPFIRMPCRKFGIFSHYKVSEVDLYTNTTITKLWKLC